MERWSEEKANGWYADKGWIRGCNFIPSNCANRLDMWQAYDWEEHYAATERELKLCKETGFNSIRIFLEFNVWLTEHDSFMAHLEQVIALADSLGISVMLGLTSEAQLPRGGTYVPKKFGEQEYALGYHQGRRPLTEEEKARKPYHFAELPETSDAFYGMVREVVGKYAKDPRIIVWNLYNEPGIVIKDRAIPILERLFGECRALDPIQPLCADVYWSYYGYDKIQTTAEKTALDLSDVISFHSYMPYAMMVPQIKELKKLNRPIFMTEWLSRTSHSNVEELYPMFYLENIACYCWGFVVGKTQTNEAWDDYWNHYYSDDPAGKFYDFSKWMHDLYRPNFRPYVPEEIELIKKFNLLADEDGR